MTHDIERMCNNRERGIDRKCPWNSCSIDDVEAVKDGISGFTGRTIEYPTNTIYCTPGAITTNWAPPERMSNGDPLFDPPKR